MFLTLVSNGLLGSKRHIYNVEIIVIMLRYSVLMLK